MTKKISYFAVQVVDITIYTAMRFAWVFFIVILLNLEVFAFIMNRHILPDARFTICVSYVSLFVIISNHYDLELLSIQYPPC